MSRRHVGHFHKVLKRKTNAFSVCLVKSGQVIVIIWYKTVKLGILILVRDSKHDKQIMQNVHYLCNYKVYKKLNIHFHNNCYCIQANNSMLHRPGHITL